MFFDRLGRAWRVNYSRLSLQRNGKVMRVKDPQYAMKKEDEDIRYFSDYYKLHNRYPCFTQVLIETRTDCNRRCSFCPQAHSQREFQEMRWEVFTKIIHDLVQMKFSGRIAFYMTNEPLLDARMPRMIQYARNASPKFFLDMNSNGNVLNEELMDQIIGAGLDNINIDDYRSDRDTYPTKISENIQKIRDAYGLNPKIQIDHRRTNEILSNRAGNVVKSGQNPRANNFCNYPFRKLAISPHGDVVLCCYDYHYNIKVGNVMDSTLEELWLSEKLNAYRRDLLQKKRTGLCTGCDAYQYVSNQRD